MQISFLYPLSVLVSVLLLVIVLASYRKLFEKYVDLKQKGNIAVVRKEAQAIIEDARKEADEIIKEGSIKADSVVNETKMFTTEVSELFSEQVRNSVKRQAVTYEVALDQTKSELVDTISDIARQIRQKALADIAEFKDALKKETLSAREVIRNNVNLEFEKIEDEIKNYKESRIAQSDEIVNEIIKEVTKNVLAKSISSEDHKDLIVNALKDAKRKNVLYKNTQNL